MLESYKLDLSAYPYFPMSSFMAALYRSESFSKRLISQLSASDVFLRGAFEMVEPPNFGHQSYHVASLMTCLGHRSA